jgi:hypothetical protein
MNIATLFSTLSLAALAALLPIVPAHADPPPGRHAPPKEAFDACAGSKEGDSCSVNIHGHDIAGTCATFGDLGLACRPSSPPPPPPEALEACASAKQGDACTVTFDGHAVTGTCEPFPGSQSLACRPAGGPPP